MIFESPMGKKVEIESIRKVIDTWLTKHPEDLFKIIIGTDSQKKGSLLTFITVVVIYRVGKGGTYYLRREIQEPKSLRDKIYTEAQMSLEVAEVLDLEKCMEDLCNLEIHVDVGQNGETRKLIKEIIKFIEDRGYKILVKPNSFAASKVADRHTK